MDKQDIIDGLDVILGRRGEKITQGDILIVEAAIMALAPRPEVGSWVLVDGFDGVLKHCGSRDALKAELDHGAFPGIFCLKEGRFYAYRLPQHLPQPLTQCEHEWSMGVNSGVWSCHKCGILQSTAAGESDK